MKNMKFCNCDKQCLIYYKTINEQIWQTCINDNHWTTGTDSVQAPKECGGVKYVYVCSFLSVILNSGLTAHHKNKL